MIARPIATPLALRLLARPPGLSSTFDPEAEDYFGRASITNRAARRSLNRYIVGLKALGDWGNLVDAAPLTSVLNRGFGTNVPTLKAARTVALMNGPTWRTNAVNMTSGYIDFGEMCSGFALGDKLSILSIVHARGITYPAIPDACLYRGSGGTFVVGSVRDQAYQATTDATVRIAFNGTGGLLAAYDNTKPNVCHAGWRITRADTLYSYTFSLALNGVIEAPFETNNDGTAVGLRSRIISVADQNVDFSYFAVFKNPVASEAQHYNLLAATIGKGLF